MRKKFLAMLLAVVMAVSLLPGTAFAADEDSEPGIYLNLKTGASETLRRAGKTFTLRGWDAEREWPDPYTLTRGEPEDFEFSHYYELPLGVTLTINTVLKEGGYPAGSVIFYAWGDPDGDGVYDQWIGITDPDTYQDVPCSPSEQGPIEAYGYVGYFCLGLNDWSGDEVSYFLYCAIQGIAETPAAAQITADYLTEYFGVNTLIEVRVATDIDAETGEVEYSYYDFLLTGEQVDPDLLEEAPEPEPEEPAEPESSITLNVKDSEALRIEGTTFRLQEWDVTLNEGEEEDWAQLLTKGDAADYTSESLNAYELPLGVTLTVELPDPGQGFTNGSNVSVAAWSDPDDDGVYNLRIYAETWVGETPTAGLLPASEEGPFKVNMSLMGGYFFANEDGVVNGEGYSGIEYAPSYSWNIPTTFQITSDYLTEFYGAHTLVQISILTDRETWTYDVYHFLLTGEQVDPDLLEGATEPDPTEPDPTEPETPFTDVPADEWYFDAVNWAVENDIALGNGDGTFTPYDICSHIQILTFLWRAAGQDEDTLQAPVETDPNVPQYQLAANWAYSNGMIDGGFDPEADCTRADAVNYIWQAFGRDDAPDGGFTDVDADADYAKAVNWAVANGITVGDDAGLNTFNPTKVCDRGEIVTFLHRAYVEAVRVK